MMRYAFDGGYMYGGSGFWSVICILVAIDLVLLGIWLWKQIKKS